MIRLLNIILLFQLILPVDDIVLTDTLHIDIQSMLNFESLSQKYTSKADKIDYYEDVSISIYDKTLNLEKYTKEMVIEYTSLINSLEDRLNIENTSISYNLGAPIIDIHYKQISRNRKNIKNNFHLTQAKSLKEQYLKLIRYYYRTIDLCEKRIDNLLSMLDKSSLDRLIEDITIEKHLIVMNFNNVANNEKFENLTSVFPDMIIKRYKGRKDVQVNHSGKIEPDLRKIQSLDDNIDKYLIDGDFFVDGYSITVNLKVYDVNNWILLKSDMLKCDIRDLDCIYDNFLWKLKNIVDPILNYESYDDFSDNQKKTISKLKLDSIDISKRNENLFAPLLEDFAVQKDYSFDIKYKDLEIGQAQGLETQTFDLSKHPNGILTKRELQKNLFEKLNVFFDDPYKIDIGNLNMNLNDTDPSYVNLDVDITFNIDKRAFEKNIKKMPYNNLKSSKKSHIFEFLNDNYLFEPKFINDLSKHDKELFPVLFFTNKNGDIQKIIIDSWDVKYDKILFGDYDVERQNKFVQMFSIINNNNNVQVNLSSNKQNINYKVVMPVSLLDNYTQLTVKVFTRQDLDMYLPINELGF